MTMQQQINFLEDLFSVPKMAESMEKAFNDVRSEVQKRTNKQISIDAGMKIGGAHKDLAALRSKFLENPMDATLFQEIAEIDSVTAYNLANKKNIFSWFSMKKAYQDKLEFKAAYGISLLIRRLPTNSKGLDRDKYLNSLLFISDELQRVKTFDEFETTFERFKMLALDKQDFELYQKQFERRSSILAGVDALLSKSPDNMDLIEEYEKVQSKFRISACYLQAYFIQDDFGLDQLGSFTDLMRSYSKRNTFRKTLLQKFNDWDDFIKINPISSTAPEDSEVTEELKTIAKKRKSVWERDLPFEPRREGGQVIEDINHPEQFLEFFGFRAVECGNTVSDDTAKGHIVNCARAFVDLADILNISVQELSQNKSLAIAFGSRGRGTALAHYEPGRHVINMTKKKGSLGVLSHEWFHSFDRFLKVELVGGNDFDLLTDGKQITQFPFEVIDAYCNLMRAIKDGQSVSHIEISDFDKYRISKDSYALYDRYDGNLQQFVDSKMDTLDASALKMQEGYTSNKYRELARKKYALKRKKELRKVCEVAAQIHYERMEGERPSTIEVPYSTNYSNYYSSALKLDGKRSKPYFSTNVELTARAFESYVNSKLQERGMVSDYLVAGLHTIYPINEELQEINKAMEQFLQVTLPYLQGSVK